MPRTLHFFSDYLTARYGAALQRVAINLYFSCPNRVDGSGGCIFCAEDGAQARHLRHALPIEEQVALSRAYVDKRYGAQTAYIAYFQSFTNTFAPVERLRECYERALRCAPFKMVIIATRPDCLSEPVLDYLTELKERYEVRVELGVQTACNQTLQRINRGHDFACVQRAVMALAARQIGVTAQVILGLPDEDVQTMVKTARELAVLPFDSIKFHQMMILRRTRLAALYSEHPEAFHILNAYDYAAALAAFLHELPETWIIMRLSADADAQALIAPKWLMDKGQFRDYFLARYTQDLPFDAFVRSGDGSVTAYHPGFKQHFHNLAGAQTETRVRFIEPAHLAARLKEADVRLLDIGFGLGYDVLCACAVARESASHKLFITTLECDRRVLALALGAHEEPLERQILHALTEQGVYEDAFVRVELHVCDARTFIAQQKPAAFDIVFLDAFSHEVNCELWTYDLFKKIYALLTPQGLCCTYSCAFPVLGGLLRAGYFLSRTGMVGGKKEGLLAHKSEPDAADVRAFDEKTLRIARETVVGLAYRDPTFCADREAIRARRAHVYAYLRSRGVPKWLKES